MAVSLTALETTCLTKELTRFCLESVALQNIMQSQGIPGGEANITAAVTSCMTTVLANLYAQASPTISP